MIFFGFSSQNLSENLLKLHSKCPEERFVKNYSFGFFSSIHDFEPYVLGPGIIVLNFVFENALYVNTRSFKRMFFLEKPHTCLSFSNFERKRSVIWLRCFSRTAKIVFYVSNWTRRVKNFFEIKVFQLVF